MLPSYSHQSDSSIFSISSREGPPGSQLLYSPLEKLDLLFSPKKCGKVGKNGSKSYLVSVYPTDFRASQFKWQCWDTKKVTVSKFQIANIPIFTIAARFRSMTFDKMIISWADLFHLSTIFLKTWPAYPATQKTGKYIVFKPKKIGEKSVHINNILSF